MLSGSLRMQYDEPIDSIPTIKRIVYNVRDRATLEGAHPPGLVHRCWARVERAQAQGSALRDRNPRSQDPWGGVLLRFSVPIPKWNLS